MHATIVKKSERPNRIVDPLNKTIHMSIRKAQRRREKHERKIGRNLFNPIRGWENLK